MFETLAAIAWLAMMFCVVSASGRSTRSTNAMSMRMVPYSAKSSSGRVAVISVTTRPMNTGIIESSSATKKPATNRPMNSPFAWRA